MMCSLISRRTARIARCATDLVLNKGVRSSTIGEPMRGRAIGFAFDGGAVSARIRHSTKFHHAFPSPSSIPHWACRYGNPQSLRETALGGNPNYYIAGRSGATLPRATESRAGASGTFCRRSVLIVRGSISNP
jgi:hypothetical protein